MMGIYTLGELLSDPKFGDEHEADDRKHSDNLNNLVIASISLGAERSFILSPRQPHRARGLISREVKPEEPKDERVNIKWK